MRLLESFAQRIGFQTIQNKIRARQKWRAFDDVMQNDLGQFYHPEPCPEAGTAGVGPVTIIERHD